MTLAAFRRGYAAALEWVVIVLMGALAVEVTAGVVFRTVGYSLVWYDEVASILLAWLTFYGSALASVKRAHIGCPEVVALMPPRVRLVLRILAELVVVGFFLLIGWTGYLVLGVLATDHLVSLPSVPVSWVQSVLPVSAALIVVAELLTLPQALRGATAATGESSH